MVKGSQHYNNWVVLRWVLIKFGDRTPVTYAEKTLFADNRIKDSFNTYKSCAVEESQDYKWATVLAEDLVAKLRAHGGELESLDSLHHDGNEPTVIEKALVAHSPIKTKTTSSSRRSRSEHGSDTQGAAKRPTTAPTVGLALQVKSRVGNWGQNNKVTKEGRLIVPAADLLNYIHQYGKKLFSTDENQNLVLPVTLAPTDKSGLDRDSQPSSLSPPGKGMPDREYLNFKLISWLIGASSIISQSVTPTDAMLKLRTEVMTSECGVTCPVDNVIPRGRSAYRGSGDNRSHSKSSNQGKGKGKGNGKGKGSR
jgi:hypothetical protein